jgi:hypothetical protein
MLVTMLRSRVLLGSMALIGLAATACSVIFTFDGYADGGRDAGAEGGDARVGDARRDARGADASIEACHGFCDDFDDRDALQGPWTGIYDFGADGSNGFISRATYESYPHSAAFHLPATGDAHSTLQLHVQRKLDAFAVTIDFDVKIVGWTEAWPTDGQSAYVILLSFGLVDGKGNHYSGGADIGPTSASANYYVLYPDGGLSHPTFFHNGADASWHHVHWAETFDVVSGAVLMTWDGDTVISQTGVQTYGESPVPPQIDVSIGSAAVPHVPTMDLYFDNVSIR